MRVLLVILGIFAILTGGFLFFFNKIPSFDETVKEKWSQVQNQYKRRADLIPQLVETVKGYAAHEKGVFAEVTEMRTKATQMKIDPSIIDDAKKIKEYVAAQNSLGGALGRLMAVSENYPQLKSDQNFLTLQSQLEGTENRIAVARKDYIVAVKDYNLALRTIPTAFIARIFFPELKSRETFEASEEDQKVPNVSFK